jgi:hypothetical protein
VTVNVQTIDGHVDGERPLNANVELYDGEEFVSNVSTGESGQRRGEPRREHELPRGREEVGLPAHQSGAVHR